MGERAFDVVVLGAGPAGEVAAGRLGEGGLRVAVVEQHLVGGECSYYACMPSKALLRPGELLAEARRVPGVPIAEGLDVAAVLARRDEVIHDRRRLEPAAVARGARRHARARARPVRRRAARARGRRRRARRGEGRHRRDGERAGDAADPRARRGAAVVEPRGDDRDRGAGEPGHPRRRRRRRRAGPGVVLTRDPGRAARGDAAPARPRGAVRVGGGRGVAARAGRRRAYREPAPCRWRGTETSTVELRDGVERHGRRAARGGGEKAGDGRARARDDRARARGSRSRSARTCARRGTTGSTRSATRTVARC